MLERGHNSLCKMTECATHWLQDKNRIVLEVNGIHLHDHVLTKNLFLDDNDIITTKQASMSLPEFECKNAKQIQYKKQCQNEEEGKTQFKSVAVLDGITGEDGKFINWSDILDTAWDSPELCEAALVSNRCMIGHWVNLSMLQNKFRRCLVDFLKRTFTNEMDHNHIDNIMSQKETNGLLVCGYQIDDKDFMMHPLE